MRDFGDRLSGNERYLLRQGVLQWVGPASPNESVARSAGFDSLAESMSMALPLVKAIDEKTPMALAQWKRALAMTELMFGSWEFGVVFEWHTVTGLEDLETITALRSVQRKMLSAHHD